MYPKTVSRRERRAGLGAVSEPASRPVVTDE
jgi:hypothetical protein